MIAKTLAVLMLAAVSFAQTKPGPGARLDALKTYLSLTDAQVVSLRTLAKQTRGNNADERQELRKLRRSSGTEEQIAALRKQLQDSRSALQGQVANILTPEQRAKMVALEDAAKMAPAMRQAMALGLLSPEFKQARKRAKK